jgi:hypothetical protein
MTGKDTVFCSICLEPRANGEQWFLLVENRWTDRLKILSWRDGLASNPELHAACCAAHVEQLVIHWMTAGTLNYPFVRPHVHADGVSGEQPVRLSSLKAELDTTGANVLGELAVHRESIERILAETPASLGSVLCALMDALPEQRNRAELADEHAAEYDAYSLTEA